MRSRFELCAAAPFLVLLCIAGGAAALELGQEAPADSEEAAKTSFREAFVEQAMFAIDLRYRYEFVDDEIYHKNAQASTLRSALNYESGSFRGLFAGITLESVTPIGNPDLYNNLGVGNRWNGVTDRPIVADPEISEIDRVYLGYRGGAGFELLAGRMAYMLDNQRFIGIAPWRQNFRSFDALSLAIGRPSAVVARYAYFDRVHYNNGADPELEAHLFHLSRDFKPGTLSGYAYLIDWDQEDRAALSSATYGARFQGETATHAADLVYLAEYARQSNYGKNPDDYALDYLHFGLGVRRAGWGLQAGWELKDGDGENAVQTPLGTNHGKNGFADRLVITPPEGSHDRYLRLTMEKEKWSWLLAYHDFEAAVGGATLGTEVDFQARYTPIAPLSVFLKVARYRADTYLTDITKIMVWTSWRWDAPGFQKSK
jgi:hypothetical protein